jgi:hypothetical protein
MLNKKEMSTPGYTLHELRLRKDTVFFRQRAPHWGRPQQDATHYGKTLKAIFQRNDGKC